MPGKKEEREEIIEAPKPKRGLLNRILNLIFPQRAELTQRVGSRPWLEAQVLAGTTTGRILEQYDIDQARVVIADENGKGRYIVAEPTLTPQEKSIYRVVMENVFYGMGPRIAPGETFSPKYIEGAVWDAARDLGLLDEVRTRSKKFMYYVSKDSIGYGKIHVPMMDPNIEEISISSYQHPVVVIHKKYAQYGWLETNITFDTEEELRAFSQRLAQRTGKSLTTAMPAVDSFTRDGDRIALTFGDEITFPGTSFCIRKFPAVPYSLPALVANGTMSPQVAAYLWTVMEFKGFPIVLGPMGSGKTTALSAMMTAIPPNQKIVTIEDVLELKTLHTNWTRFHTRTGYSLTETRYDIKPFDLVKLSMRYRPDHIIVGEIRGEEVQALIHSSSLGHGGACTMHAYSPEAALVRLRTPPMEVSEGGLMMIWCFVQLARVQLLSGAWVRRVTRVDEVDSEDGKIVLRTVFRWDARTDTYSDIPPEKLVKISRRLREAALARGWTERELAANLRNKIKCIEHLIKEKRLGQEDFWNEIKRFYAV